MSDIKTNDYSSVGLFDKIFFLIDHHTDHYLFNFLSAPIACIWMRTCKTFKTLYDEYLKKKKPSYALNPIKFARFARSIHFLSSDILIYCLIVPFQVDIKYHHTSAELVFQFKPLQDNLNPNCLSDGKSIIRNLIKRNQVPWADILEKLIFFSPELVAEFKTEKTNIDGIEYPIENMNSVSLISGSIKGKQCRYPLYNCFIILSRSSSCMTDPFSVQYTMTVLENLAGI